MDAPLIAVDVVPLGDSQHALRCCLQRPKALNALNRDMIDQLQQLVDRANSDPAVAFVVIEGGESRGFCAGGDLKSLVMDIKHSQSLQKGLDFFRAEYRLNEAIRTSETPIVVWGHGFVMGGGLGLLAPAQYRVAAPNTVFAMPELAIGLVPDVGATRFLNDMPHSIGWWLGFSGERFTASDGVYLGVVDHVIEEPVQSWLDHMVEQWQPNCNGAELLERTLHDLRCSIVQSDYELLAESIESCLDPAASADQWADNLWAKMGHHSAGETIDQRWHDSLERVAACPPLVRHVIQQQMIRGADLSWQEARLLEFNLVTHRLLRPDFYEGVRCVLFEKERMPVWLESPHESAVNMHFVRLHDEIPL